jgi:hypothetical protein
VFTRRFHRIPVDYDAYLVAEDASLPCVIENISEGGLNILITVKSSPPLATGGFVTLQFEVPRGEEYEMLEREISLTCEIIWIHEARGGGLRLGLRVADENLSYQNLVKTLYMKRVGFL